MNTSDAIYELYSANAARVVLPESPDRVLTILDESGNEMGTVHKTELGKYEDAAEGLLRTRGDRPVAQLCLDLIAEGETAHRECRLLCWLIKACIEARVQ